MKRLVVIGAAMLTWAGAADAHTLDEYVQALRVEVGSARLAVYLDLTPGTNVAAHVLERIDTNGDGVLSPTEAEMYGRAVLADLAIALDGQDVLPSLVRVETLAADGLRDGQGTIRIEASVAASAKRGRHRLVIRNTHLPAFSVYLANALLPRQTDIRILHQKRDVQQQAFWLDYEVRGVEAAGVAWLLSASIILIMLVFGRRAAHDAIRCTLH